MVDSALLETLKNSFFTWPPLTWGPKVIYFLGENNISTNRSTQFFFRVYIFPRKLKSGSIFFHANSKVGIYFSTHIEKWIYFFHFHAILYPLYLLRKNK